MEGRVCTKMSMQEKTLRMISIILNWIWGIFLLPIIAISFIAGVSTLMMNDSGKMSTIGVNLIIFTAYLFWGTPIITIITMILSFNFRKKLKYIHSIMIQLIPVIYFLLTFCFLTCILKISL